MSDVPALRSPISGFKAKLHELYSYRNVMRSLIEKSLFGRYKNSFLGFAWHFATPVIYVVLCYFISEEVRDKPENYWVLIASGIMAYHMLSSSVAGGTTAFTGNKGIIKKMYIPKEILVFTKTTVSLIIMTIGYVFIIAGILISGYGVNFLGLLMLIPLVVAMYFFCAGCTLALSSITVYVPDVQYLLGSMGLVFFVFTPIRKLASSASGIISTIYWYNPLTYYLECFHSVLYLKEIPDLGIYAMCFLFAIIAMLIGIIVFNYLKRGFVERF